MSATTAMQLNNHWTRLMRRLRWVSHPITIFVGLQIVWLAITIIWVIWFVGAEAEISKLAARFGGQYFDSTASIAILITGCILLGVLLFGTITLFVFGQKQSAAARQQRNFVSSVTHELKSPLASLQLGFETLGARKLPEETHARVMSMIGTDIDRLRRLVDQILVAGRIDRGLLTFEEETPQDIDIHELLDKIIEKLSYVDHAVNDRVVVQAPKGFRIRGSRSVLILVLNNLIENALKYSPKGEQITVAVAVEERETVIKVEDRGMGLDKADMRRIFRMFHRSESAIKKAIPGTGLGLYIVRSAVTMLGGRVWVESPGRGSGSTFFVAFPKG